MGHARGEDAALPDLPAPISALAAWELSGPCRWGLWRLRDRGMVDRLAGRWRLTEPPAPGPRFCQ